MFTYGRDTRRSFALGDVPSTPRRPRRPHSRTREDHPAAAGKILLLGRIRELALYRSEYLEGKGYEVLAPANRSEALETFRHGSFDVVILTYTLPNDLVLEYAQMAREYCPSCPLIVITNADLGDRNVAPDAIVIADHGPDALLRALRTLMKNNHR